MLFRPRLLSGIATALMLTGAPALAAGSTPNDRAAFLMKLHAINAAEMEVGKLAQDKGQTPEVKSFGKMLAEDHEKADAKVAALARKEGLMLEPKAEPTDVKDLKTKLKQMGDGLKAATGAQFDRTFADDMVQGHDEAIKLVEDAQKRFAGDAGVKELADGLLPSLQQHRTTATTIRDQLAAAH
jgi:putative membrane protein